MEAIYNPRSNAPLKVTSRSPLLSATAESPAISTNNSRRMEEAVEFLDFSVDPRRLIKYIDVGSTIRSNKRLEGSINESSKKLGMQPTSPLTVACVGSRTCLNDWPTAQAGLVGTLIFLLAGCSSGPTTIPFLNNSHRQIYSLNEEDLKKVQFYVSTDVVAQIQDPMATQSFQVPRLTLVL